MEVEKIQRCRRSRISNGSTTKDDDTAIGKKHAAAAVAVADGCRHVRSSWPHSRIVRVSRASGGKDRHSKVLTAKGLRDRRVRLSVSTAIQFYHLQDRLGYDQPSKAVEWLIQAASAAIADLPPLDGSFPDPTLLRSAMCTTPSDATTGDNSQQSHLSLTKSGCSSNSDTSKGSVLSLSRSNMRNKARERARERTNAAKVDKVAENSPNSFTELLTGVASGNDNNSTAEVIANQSSTIPKAIIDYFSSPGGTFSQSQKIQHHQQQFLPQSHFGITPTMVPLHMGEPLELQQISFLAQDHVIPVEAVAPPADLNFSISSGIAGLNNRGTLQSNSAHHYLQKFSSPLDGSNLSSFYGPAAPSAATGAGTSPMENQFFAAAAGGFDARLQLYYTDDYRHLDVKGKGKN